MLSLASRWLIAVTVLLGMVGVGLIAMLVLDVITPIPIFSNTNNTANNQVEDIPVQCNVADNVQLLGTPQLSKTRTTDGDGWNPNEDRDPSLDETDPYLDMFVCPKGALYMAKRDETGNLVAEYCVAANGCARHGTMSECTTGVAREMCVASPL